MEQERFLGEEKYAFVHRYLENVHEAHSITTLTSDSGIRTPRAPSELGTGDISGNYRSFVVVRPNCYGMVLANKYQYLWSLKYTNFSFLVLI